MTKQTTIGKYIGLLLMDLKYAVWLVGSAAWSKYYLTLVLLNKLRCHTSLFSANQITWSGMLLYIHILNGKQCRSRSVGFFRSQLIWIYTVCKDKVYPGSAGQGLTGADSERFVGFDWNPLNSKFHFHGKCWINWINWDTVFTLTVQILYSLPCVSLQHFYYLWMCKIVGWVANNIDPDQKAHSAIVLCGSIC